MLMCSLSIALLRGALPSCETDLPTKIRAVTSDRLRVTLRLDWTRWYRLGCGSIIIAPPARESATCTARRDGFALWRTSGLRRLRSRHWKHPSGHAAVGLGIAAGIDSYKIWHRDIGLQRPAAEVRV